MFLNWIKLVAVWVVVLAISSFFFGETGEKIAGMVFAGFYYLVSGIMLLIIPASIVWGIVERRNKAKATAHDDADLVVDSDKL